VGDIDLSEYCRDVEEHLTRVNGGHLVRVVGGGFELVRQWAEMGIPISVVHRGIDRKAERHLRGVSRRPLRIEFCEADVREVHDEWRRAVGVWRGEADAAEGQAAPPESPRRPSLTKQLDRVIDRLGRAAGRLDLPEPLQRDLGDVLSEVVRLRDAAKGARGDAREAVAAELPPLDQRLLDAARHAAGDEGLRALEAQAEGELGAYRARLSPDAWRQAVDVTVARLLRDRYGLPTL
jgi:hypothetical protein